MTLRFVGPALVVAACFCGCKPSADANRSSAPPLTKVSTAVPLVREVQDYEDSTGRVTAQYSVELRARVTGYLDDIKFQDGADVEKGALLFVIDRKPFKAADDNAKALVAVRKASSAYRDAEFKRNQELIAKNAVSKSEFDQSAAAFEEAKAMVESSLAQAESAKLNLDFTEIHAPISGMLSNRKLDVGNLVVADQTLLTTIVSVDPVYVYFDVDERRMLRIQQEVRDGRIKLAADGRLPMTVGLDNETGYPHAAMLDFIDNQLDPTTGTIRMRAVVPNPKPAVGKRRFAPGMFARVRTPLGDPRSALLITEQAVGSDQGRKFVYVVDSEKKAQYRPVTLGRSERGLVVVESGLQAGDAVIVAGVQRVRPGIMVEANSVEMKTFETAAPPPKAKPDEASAPSPSTAAAPAAAPSSAPATSPATTAPATK